MSLRRLLSGLVALTVLPAATLVSGAGPASAADFYFAATPKRVVVNQSYENIAWGVRGGDRSWVDSVDVSLEHAATRETSGMDFTFDGDTTGSFKFYNWERMGRYKVYGSAYDYDYNEMSVSPTYVTVKLASKSTLTAKRNGKLVTLRAMTKRYNGSYPMWKAHRGATVTYQRYARGAWRTLASKRVTSRGVTTLTVRKPRATSYRAVVRETSRVWSSTSGRVRR